MKKFSVMVLYAMLSCVSNPAHAARGSFDFDRWNDLQSNLRTSAQNDGISADVIDATLKNPVFIPRIVYNDKNQSEFKLTLRDYLNRTVNNERVKNGLHMSKTYPTLLGKTYNKYGVPRHVILAFWGMESNYGTVKKAYKLKDAFFTLMYDGRREAFFKQQMLALMKIADKNKLDINNIRGSWAGAVGHFQFIPTTLAQYGVDGNGDNKIDIIGSVGDAMFSAGNYLNKLGWNEHERFRPPLRVHRVHHGHQRIDPLPGLRRRRPRPGRTPGTQGKAPPILAQDHRQNQERSRFNRGLTASNKRPFRHNSGMDVFS